MKKLQEVKNRKAGRLCKGALSVILALTCAGFMSSCRPTDFFTEIIISPYATTVDENNPEQTVVNSPDATEESSHLSALDWSENASQSEETQNLVTYSPTVTTTLLAHHSRFDLKPRFSGVLSSDPVTLYFDESNAPQTDESSATAGNSDDTETTDDETTAQTQNDQQGSGTPTEEESEVAQDTPEATTDKTQNDGSSETDKGNKTSADGTDETDNEEEGNKESDSDNNDEGGGYDGPTHIYDAGDAFSEVQHADQLAATGQAAVIVQAIGGKGALCAMDVDTYNGNFSSVFGDELADNFTDTALLWADDGTSSDDLVSVKALVNACGQGGVIVYDQNEAGWKSRFDSEDIAAFNEAGIQLVPIDLSTVQGIIDAAEVIGEALSESAVCEEDSESNAKAYASKVSSIVSQVAASHDGGLAVRDESSDGATALTTYSNCPVTETTALHVFTAIGTEYLQNVTYTGENSSFISTSGGLLYARTDNASPLSFWAQTAGVWNIAADEYEDHDSKTYGMIWGLANGTSFSFTNNLARCVNFLPLLTQDTTTGTTSYSNYGNGLGSSAFPYLIVSGSGSMTSDNVKKSVVSQMNRQITAYSVLPWGSQAPETQTSEGESITSYIGSTTNNETGSVFLDQGVSVADTVRANPSGLLGSWTDGSLESVLESAWLARIYSGAPENSSYQPLCNLSKDTLKDIVVSFYEDIYRMSSEEAAAAYEKVVTDQGI